MKTIIDLVNQSFINYPNNHAMNVLGDKNYTYKEVSEKVRDYATLLINLGVQKGDKVALLSPSSPEWGMAYLAIVSLGAIAVPLLPDFCKEEVNNCLNHSDTKIIFVSQNKKGLVDPNKVNYLIDLETNQLLNKQIDVKKVNYSFDNKNVKPDDIASIIYTSGTTGNSKGVELTHENISFMMEQCDTIISITEEDRFLSILPMAHIYEFSIGFILPMAKGSTITYLSKPASPSVLMDALQKVKPTIMLSVPLVIEKVYRKKVAPLYDEGGPFEKYKDHPIFRKGINKLIGLSLKKAFGGKIKFFGVGGAKINPEVETFLKEANFPYAIGYGLTETSPLIAGTAPNKTKLQSTGPKLRDVEVKIIDENEKGIGEIVTRGKHVMKGYHKEPELTNAVMTEDGFFKTGDLGYFGENNYLYISGRKKNMILGPSGENIYPENIAFVINQHPLVEESLVLQDETNSLIALVKLNEENVKNYLKEHASNMTEIINHIKQYVNSKVNKNSFIKHIIETDGFEKTATQKIKTYKYQNKQNN